MIRRFATLATLLLVIALPFPAAAVSSDATLSALSLSGGKLSPSFSPDWTSYTLVTEASTTTISATPAAGATRVCRLLGSPIDCAGIPLALGENTLTVTVTAEDGVSTERYSILVTRQTPTPTPSPTPSPSPTPTPSPTPKPTPSPTPSPTPKPTPSPTPSPTPKPTPTPSPSPTPSPTPSPVVTPTPPPTETPLPTETPTPLPTESPTPSGPADGSADDELALVESQIPLDGRIVFTASGFGANSDAEAWLTAAGDTYLGALTADADGVITASLALPAAAVAGEATVTVIGSDPGGNRRVARSAITLGEAAGLGPIPLVVAIVIAVLGLGALAGGLIVRRREAQKPPALPWES